MSLWRYLLRGSDDLILSKAWLADRERLTAYEAYTREQLQQGSVAKDSAACRRDAFWRAVEAKQVKRGQTVTTFRQRSA